MGKALGSLDNLFIQLESPTTPMHVAGLLTFRCEQPADELPELLGNTPVRVEPFDQRLIPSRWPLVRPHWDEVAAVDLNQHLSVVELPAPGSDEQLMQTVSELHSRHLDRDRPLWECALIRGLEQGRFALYYKIHHACIDGVTAIHRIQGSLSSAADQDTKPPWAVSPERAPRAPLPKSLGRSLRAIWRGLRVAIELFRSICSSALGALRGDWGRAALPYTCPFTPFNLALSGERSVAWTSLPLSGVRELAARAGVKINDIALGLTATVLREHLMERGALPRRPVVAMVPFSLRRTDSEGTAGNDVSCILVHLATHLADPVERLRMTASSAADGKRMLRAMSPAAAATYWKVIGAPAIVAQLAGLRRRAPLPWNVCVSNVPGPKDRLFFRHAELEAIYPASLLFERQGFNVTLISYGDRLDFGLIACRQAVPTLPRLALRFRAAYQELMAALAAGGNEVPTTTRAPETDRRANKT